MTFLFWDETEYLSYSCLILLLKHQAMLKRVWLCQFNFIIFSNKPSDVKLRKVKNKLAHKSCAAAALDRHFQLVKAHRITQKVLHEVLHI